MFGATANEPDLLHATGFDAPDPVGAVRFPGGRTLLVVGSMELGRARRQSREGVEVLGPAALGFAKGDRAGPEDLLAAALSREGVADVIAASTFPLGAGLALERRGVRVAKAARNPVAAEREVKTADELRKIRRAQSEKVPFMLVLGRKEAESGLVAVRTRDEGDKGAMPFDAFLEMFRAAAAKRG